MGYQDINRGPELMQAYTNLQAWRAKPKVAKIAAFKAVAKAKTARVKTKRAIGYILPFDGKAGIYVQCRQIATNQTGNPGADLATLLKTATSLRVKETVLAADTVFPGKNYKFARVVLTKRLATDDKEDAVSRKTENVYHRYRTESTTTPFGAKSAGEAYMTGENDIRNEAAIKTFLENPGNRIGFDPQG